MGYDGGMKSSSSCSEVSSGTLESSSGSAEFSSYSYETTEISENYDDCAINESDYSGIQENSDEPTENYDDCELSAEYYEPEESVSTEDVDDYSDCAKETYYQEELENKSIEEQIGDSDFESSFSDAIKSNEVQSEIAEDSSENIKEDIEKEIDSEITDKQQEKIEVETKKQLEDEYENSEISDEEVQEIENDKTDEEIENIEEQEQSINDEIDDSVEENEKQMEEDDVKEQAEKDAYETVRDSELTDEQKTELVENKEEQIKEKIEDEQEKLPENDENLDCVDVESLDEDTKVEVENLDSEDIVQESINDVEDNTDTEITDETKDEINEKFNKEINAQSEDEKITVDELKELEESEIEEKTEQIEECSEAVDAEIEKSVEDAVESENLSETEIKESVEEDAVEVIDDEKLSNEQVEEIIDEKEEKIENTIEAEQMEQASEEKIEEAAEEIEENKEGKESKDLSKRIDDLLSKDNVTSSEVKELSDENSESLNNALQEQIQLETEVKNKFNEALKLDRGTEEYKTTLQEYNALKDQKSKVDEDVKQLKNQQDILDKKSLELRDAQIEKGKMAVAASETSLGKFNELENEFANTYYEQKSDYKKLAQISEDNSKLIGELSAEKDSIKLAMDAKMAEITQYVYANNLGRYETSYDTYYQKLNSEYLKMKSAYDKVDYSIVKLDKNNRLISEVTGKEYHSILESQSVSQIEDIKNESYEGGANQELKIKEYRKVLKEYCETNGYVDTVDFSDFDPHVAYDLAKSVVDAKNDFPDLKVNYLGSIDNQVKGIHATLQQSQYVFYKQNGIEDNLARQMAKAYADDYINFNKLNDTEGTYAWSLRTGNPSLEQFDGVAVNNEYASNYNQFLEEKKYDEYSQWAPVGCGTPKACSDHELGHEIDKLLGASNDSVINDMYSNTMRDNKAKDVLSGYSATNVKEFIAEAYSEYRNNPKPREVAVAVYNRLIELRDQKILQKELKLGVR